MPLNCENVARYQLSGLDHLAETGEPSPAGLPENPIDEG
jgi:hypothetical protein